MLTLGQKVNTTDPAKVLSHNEAGQFEAISPSGERFRIECRQNASIVSFVSLDNPGQWSLEKIAELPQSQQEQTQTSKARAAGQGGSY